MGVWPRGLLESLVGALGAGDVLVALGASGQGKTTLVTDLRAMLLAQGKRTCILGADPGQQAWGPPACISLVGPGALPMTEIRALSPSTQPDSTASERRLAFTGSLDPVRHHSGYCSALVRLRSAVSPQDILLVDAPGVVRGWLAIRFVESLLSMLGPTVVVLLKERESREKLGPWLEQRGDLRLVELSPSSEAAGLSKDRRRQARTHAFDLYLAEGREILLPPGEVTWVGPVPPDGGWQGCVVGLLDDRGETLAVGEVTAAESSPPPEGLSPLLLPVALGVRCPLADVSRVHTVVFGSVRRDAEGLIGTAGIARYRRARSVAPWTLRPRPAVPIPISWPESAGSAPFEPRMLNSLFGDPALLLRHKVTRRSLLFDLGWLEPLPAKVLHAVTDVFISHAHMDHLQGLVTMLRLMMGTGGTVSIYGPEGIDGHVAGLLEAFRFNLLGEKGPRFVVHAWDGESVRVTRFTCGDPLRSESLEPRPARDGMMLVEPDMAVRAWPLEHNTTVLAYHFESAGFPIERTDGVQATPRRFRLVYVVDASDTPENRDRIVRHASGADLLVCESMFTQEHRDRAHRTGHLTARATGEIARAAGVARLVPFHFSARYENDPGVIYQELLPVFDRFIPAVPVD